MAEKIWGTNENIFNLQAYDWCHFWYFKTESVFRYKFLYVTARLADRGLIRHLGTVWTRTVPREELSQHRTQALCLIWTSQCLITLAHWLEWNSLESQLKHYWDVTYDIFTLFDRWISLRLELSPQFLVHGKSIPCILLCAFSIT